LKAKSLFIYSVSYFNLVGLGALFGGAKPTKAPVATGMQHQQLLCYDLYPGATSFLRYVEMSIIDRPWI